jgi:hypothetical protein
MSDGKKFLSPFKGPLERVTRVIMVIWGFFIFLGALTIYLRPILPWIAGGVSLAIATWVVIAIVRWRRSKW